MNIQHVRIWAIYDHPKDYPNYYVARLFLSDRLTNQVIARSNLEELRTIFKDQHLTCINRQKDDDPVIVETWF